MNRPSPARRSRPAPRDPYGIGPAGGTPVAAILSVVGLAIAAVVTLGLFTGRVPLIGPIGPGDGRPDPNLTPAPSGVVNVPDEVTFPGSIVYVKGGNLWIQAGPDVRQLTDTGRDSMPAWSSDGAWIYFIETRPQVGRFLAEGRTRTYDMTVPILSRVRPDGSGRETLLSGRYRIRSRNLEWFYWIRQPAVSPDGRTIAVASDGPDPTERDVVIQLYDVEADALRDPGLPKNFLLGHQDPAWRADGAILLFVQLGREGSRATPRIFRYDVARDRSSAVTAPGYTQPAFSPDGRFIAATKTGAFGTDVVILDARTGGELLRVTADGRSWAPAWSPAGDAIAYLHIEGQIVDVKMAGLEGGAPAWTVEELPDVTQLSGLDGSSRPTWYVPPEELPATPPPSAAPSQDPATAAPS